MKTLEILIPTYGRPHSAAEAMESSLRSTDDRFSVRCNSNGFEPQLEKYRAFDQRLVYDSFDQNEGIHANWAFLLKTTNAKFCMLLSDEDRIMFEGIPDFLDFLEGLDPSVSVVSCSIYDLVERSFYFLPRKRFQNVCFDINMFAAHSLVPTYMSGIVYRTEALRELNLENFTKDIPGNAYDHINIAWYLLRDSKLKFYYPMLVLKGEEVKYGGDGHSHKAGSSREVKNNLDLNPNVYGPYARIQQFFYQTEQLSGARNRLKTLPYYIAVVHNILFFRYAVLNSDKIAVLPQGTSLVSEIRRGLDDANRVVSGKFALIALIFKFSILSPVFLSNPFASSLRILIGIINRVYFLRALTAKT
jgi:hypothetical protein